MSRIISAHLAVHQPEGGGLHHPFGGVVFGEGVVGGGFREGVVTLAAALLLLANLTGQAMFICEAT
jgi:hypothetical protein